MQRVELKNLTVRCVIGFSAPERQTPQRVVVSCSVHLLSDRVVNTYSLRNTVDYAALAKEVSFILQSARFCLLETAVSAIAHYIVARATVEISKVEVEITKPDVFAEPTLPQVGASYRATDLICREEEKSKSGKVCVVHESKDCGIYILHVYPKHAIKMHYQQAMEECVLILTDNLHIQGRQVQVGLVKEGQHLSPNLYDNYSDAVQKILCINHPKFTASDKILVGVPLAVLQETSTKLQDVENISPIST